MLSPYLKRIIIDISLVLAFLFGALYAKQVFIDFLISLFHFSNKINISSLAYVVARSLFILVPLIMLTTKTVVSKNKLLKCFFYIIGICYILGNTWVFYYLKEQPFSHILTASIPQWLAGPELKEKINNSINIVYSVQYNKALVFNYLIWNCYDLFGIIFSFIQGFLYINLARKLDGHRADVVKSFILITVLSLALPFVHMLLVEGTFYLPVEWNKRNIMLIFEAVFIIFSLKMSASNKMFWADVMW